MKETKNFWNVGINDPKLRVFQKDSFTESGLRHGSYLIKIKESYMLIGTVPKCFISKWADHIRRITSFQEIEWMILLEETNCVEAVKFLLSENPKMNMICSHTTHYALEKATSSNTEVIEIRNDRTLLFEDREIEFLMIGSKVESSKLYVFDRKLNYVFTADAFGAYYAGNGSRVSELNDLGAWLDGCKRYHLNLVPNERFDSMQLAIDCMRKREVIALCPALGPVVDVGIEELFLIYQGKKQRSESQHKLLILHDGDFSLGTVAAKVLEGAMESGISECENYDLSQTNRDFILSKIRDGDAVCFGTDAIDGDVSKAIWDIVTSLKHGSCKGRQASVFYTVNGSDSNIDQLRNRLDFLGFDLNLQDYSISKVITDTEVQNAVDYGFGIGCSIQKISNPRKPKLVKCLVCGEIFDASLGICPVCGVGLDQCAPVDETEIVFKRNTDLNYVIIGGGIAAVSAAEAIRMRDETGKITVLSSENYLPINRPMLTKDLAKIKRVDPELYIHEKEWYDKLKIELKIGQTVVRIDLNMKEIETEQKKKILYDKLILATGAECFVPPIKGSKLNGVFVIRHLSDTKQIEKYIQPQKHAVIIGGGVLGLEAASELTRAGMKVTVLEVSNQIIGRQIDFESAKYLKEQMEKMGTICREGVSIEEIEGKEQATAVKLEDGTSYPADMIIISCGNRANTQLAQMIGAKVDRAIVVNQRMETTVSEVYACGDCAQCDGINYQLWQEASEQGKIAGANVTGEKIQYKKQILGLNFDGFGTTLYAIGDPGKKENVPYRNVRLSDEIRISKENYWFLGNSLEGAVIIGNPEKTSDISLAVTTHKRYENIF